MPNVHHLKALTFVRQNLFSGIENFSEFEARVASLPDEKSRGDAFEVFAEAYLATQRKHDTANVWPLTAVPTQTLQTLGLATKDYGVDGVFESLLGHFSAYQVKFRTNRPSLTWRELSTFMALADSPHIRSRVLITNCDELPSVLNERQGFFCIRGTDLDRLEAEDFCSIEAWLADIDFVVPKKQPRPHQSKALDALIPALQNQDRVTAIMACGTGKTLVALWIAERLQAGRILVLVPSLALLRQVLHEWLRESCLPDLAYLCVCSDPTVKDGLDSIATPQSDLDFEVSTESKSVRGFLDSAFNGTKIVFCTYQSASVVGEALNPGESFDFAVFDEAHKTAGREGRNFAFALDDARLRIRKRLFLTATPRHYNPLDRDREGEAKLVLSMDNPTVYGEQAFKLTFAEAARLGIICRYKVLISVITSDEVNNELLNRGEVLVNDETIRAREVANHIALRNAVKNHGTRHIFTFHRTVRDARDFVEPQQGISSHLEDFSLFHVNGNMSAAQRERVMRDFRDSERGLISNARCLTEGVDVPAVDMVAFLSPRRSLVDIVQAIGRAMRNSPTTGKEFGYVLVPLFIDIAQGESIEDAVARAQFDEVWDVIQTLQEQDEALAELIQQMAETKGRTGKFDASGLEMIEFCGENIALDALINSVSVRAFDELFGNWDVRYGELMQFKAEHGHCRVPQKKYLSNMMLGFWVSYQRRYYAENKLASDRIAKLEFLGFEWNAIDADWQKNFEALYEYFLENGNSRVPTTYKPNLKLGGWVTKQRKSYRDGELSRERISKLETIHFEWEPYSSDWFKMFDLLKGFYSEHGHCRLPDNFGNKKLSRWMSGQRKYLTKSKLTQDKIDMLDSIKFEWDPFADEWERNYQILRDFHSIYGNCHVPRNFKNKKLALWVNVQRRVYSKGRLPIERIQKLEVLGFVWNPNENDWLEMFEKLQSYKEELGNCRVPKRDVNYETLGAWVGTQRGLYAKGALSEDRISKLADLGFEWDLIKEDWDLKYSELEAYKDKNGDCRVPAVYKPNIKLGNWVFTQRAAYSKGNLSADRIAKLKSLGFEWDPNEIDWNQKFEALKCYINEHGNCKISKKRDALNGLRNWTHKQRQDFKQCRLTPDRIAKLEAIGFEWQSVQS